MIFIVHHEDSRYHSYTRLERTLSLRSLFHSIV